MPTRAVQDLAYQQSTSWTDALPVCRDSGVGSATNQIYRQDGNRRVRTDSTVFYRSVMLSEETDQHDFVALLVLRKLSTDL